MTSKPRIGFIGQGWIGKNYADDFEQRGYEVVRFGLEPAYATNKERIAQCDIVLVAVPTPTTVDGFDDSIVRGVIGLVGKGKIAVIKSTMQPGTTESIQEQYPDRFVLINTAELVPFPKTWNFAPGAVVPIPTFPFVLITTNGLDPLVRDFPIINKSSSVLFALSCIPIQ
jgi:hypothetical protein